MSGAGQVTAWRQASRRTHSPIGTIRRVSSASGMNLPGLTKPCSSLCQRSSASKLISSSLCEPTTGWKLSLSSLLPIACRSENSSLRRSSALAWSDGS